MTAEEARKLADENREGYIAGLLSHYLSDVSTVIDYAAKIGRYSAKYCIPLNHVKDISVKWSKQLRSLGYKVHKNKDATYEISWQKEEQNG